RGKLTVRERIDLLFDPGTFVELGLLAQNRDGSDTAPADGVVTGHGDVDGRQVWVIAYDFTVMAGSMGAVGEQFKAARVRELAVRYRKPLVWLLDSAGARLVKAATGEDVTDHDMGGSQVHCYESGVGDNEVENDAECIVTVRRFLSYLPSSNAEAPPFVDTGDPAGRLVEGLEKIVPVSPRPAYDVRKVIKAIFDRDSWFEVKPTWAK